LKIAGMEILELHNIPVTPPLFKEPVRTAVRLLKIKTDDGITGISQIGGFMHSATIASCKATLHPFCRAKIRWRPSG